jgi:glucokinase
MTKNESKRFLLAGDIGATNTRLALIEVGGDERSPFRVANFKGEKYPGLVPIIEEFLGSERRLVVAASIGAAGPVVQGKIKLTNIPWVVDSNELTHAFGWDHAWLLNDLQAIANSVPLLSAAELHVLKAGVAEEHGSIAVLAPGTGLGVGYLTWAAGRYHPYATEGGHADFAPANSLQDDLLRFMRQSYPQVAVEHVCAGVGLPNVFEFLKSTGRFEMPSWLAEEMETAGDKTRVIVEEAVAAKPGSEICQEVMHLFIDVLAAEAGSLALAFGATGGVYIGGGIPPRILDMFQRYNFVRTFAAKTGYEYYLERFPIHVILKTDAGLLGAAHYGNQQLLQPEN